MEGDSTDLPLVEENGILSEEVEDVDFKLVEMEMRSASFASNPAPPLIVNTSFTSRNSPAMFAISESCPLPLEAIKNGYVDEVQVWIEEHSAAHASINRIVDTSHGHVRNIKTALPRKKMTALNYAAFFGKEDIVQLLLDHGADPSKCNIVGKNAVHCAILSDREDKFIVGMLKKLLGDDTEWKGDVQRSYPLVHLPKQERAKSSTLQGPKQRGTLDIDSVTLDGWTALTSAIKINLPKTFEYLIAKGADPTKAITTATGVNKCSLVCAACNDGKVLMRLLLILSSDYVTSVINKRFGKSRYTALHYAMLYARVKNVQLLLQREADPNIEDGYGNLPIHYASEALTVEDFKTLVELLRECLNKPDSNGYTLLHRVVRLKKEEYAKILINEFKADVRCRDNFGRYPLHYACETHGSLDIVPVLTDRYIIVAKDNDGYTPLHLAVKANDHKLVQVLLGAQGRAVDPGTKVGHEQYPIGVDIPDDKGCNVIHLAVLRKGHDEAFETMIKAFLLQMSSINELINTGNDDGKTPLHLVIKYELNSRIKILLDNGADVTIKDNKGRSCLESAFEHEIPVQLILLLTRRRYSYQQRLNMAIKYKRYELVKAFLANGATIGLEVMKSAVLTGDEELAMILVRYAPNLNEELTSSIRYDTLNKKAKRGSKWQEEYKLEMRQGASGNEENGILDTPITVSSQTEDADEVEELNFPKTTLFRELIKRMPNVATEALDRSIERTHVSGRKVEVTMNYQHLHHKQIFTEINGCCKGKEQGTTLIDPLQIIVNNERTSLLKHPVVRSYVYEKWKTVGLWLYLSYYILFFLFFSLLALFSIVVHHPQVKICENLTNSSSTVIESEDCGPFRKLIATRVLAILVLIFALYHLCLEAYWLITRFVDYFLNITNYFQLGLYISSILFVTSALNTCGCPVFWQWYYGITSVALGTLNLIVLSSNFPLVSIYVIMYTEILITFMRLIVFGILLMCAFALIMFMMFHDPNARYYNFNDPGYALLTTLDMTTSPGVGLETLFNLDQPAATFTTIPFHYLNILVWLLLLLLFPLVFNNMLTSLAVDDVKKVREKAELKQVALQIQVFTDTKNLLSCGILKYLLSWCKSTSRKVQLMKKYTIQLRIRERQHFWREFWHTVSGWISRRAFGNQKFLQNIEDDSYEKRRHVEIELLKGRRFDTQGFARERVNDLHAMISALRTDMARKS